MQKKFLLFLLVVLQFFLVGCTSQGTEVVLSEVSADAASADVESVDVARDLAAADSASDGAGISAVDAVSEADSSFDKEDEAAGGDAALAVICVYVCGAVKEPGVYELSEGSRCLDAVDAAGGFSEDADRNYVNLAALLTDGVKLQIPTIEEVEGTAPGKIDSFEGGSVPDVGGGTGAGLAGSGLININKASKEELTALPGIGNATAEKIVKYREEHGGFKNLEDIMKVSGIKDKLFSRIREYITI
jgi:competence protein ComEA